MNKKRWLAYAVFGLAFYLLFLVIELPAAWLAWGLNRYTGGGVRLDPITGTAWSGKGHLVINYPQAVPHDFGQTEWSVDFPWLFAGRFQVSLRTDHPDRQIKTTIGLFDKGVVLKNTEATFATSFIIEFYRPASLFSPQGRVRLSTPELAIGRENVEGAATLDWQNAGSGLSSIQPLGDYRLEITGAGTHANFTLTTLRGPLELTGQAQWQVKNGQIQFNGSAFPREHAEELEPLLKLLGEKGADGRRKLVLNTVIPFPKSMVP